MTNKDIINNSLPTKGHSPIYVMHKFFGRKQENVFRKYIQSYSNEGEVILDPFCGSGVAVGEALRIKRKVIAIDINPISIFITRNTIKHIDEKNITDEFATIKNELEEIINQLYITSCRKCGKEVPVICFTWKNEQLIDARYICPIHGKLIDPVNNMDINLLERIIKGKIPHFFDNENRCKYWFPENKLYYQDGTPFLKKERFESVDELFTKRNLIALAILYDRILQTKDPDLREAFKFAFSSITHLASKMTPVRPTRPFSSAWVQQSYWFCPHNMESNVWILFERAINGRQGLLKAKVNLPINFKTTNEANNFNQLISDNSRNFLLLESSITDVKEIPENSIDYVITDPPYAQSIQYAELLFMWGCWLNLMNNFNEIAKKEIIENIRQKKRDIEYEKLMTHAFQKIFHVLKPNHFCTVTFHNPSIKYRNILFRSLIKAGFEFERVVYQHPTRASAKSLLQPFGSQKGDYFFQFKKSIPLKPAKERYRPITMSMLEKLIINLVRRILEEKGKPLHYTEIQNLIDPLLYEELGKNNWIMEFNPPNIETILERHIGSFFQISDIEGHMFSKKIVKVKGWGLKKNKLK